ncbi:hypothetical protein A1D23_06435 [Chelonobacter oris]|uniref:PTS sugar transporter subunit IIA n=1 Tax=Chelonobacter oris TaxID=505317 RepID=UPI002446A58F|nr:glucose PTS transporter subunit IIA [Chelonobacter oris]MDH2999728.1 hypothetical protein [Chelonobacter oris]
MFAIFKSKKHSFNATQNGRLLRMEDIPDDMFSEKMLGDGFAILPSDENVYAPIAGEVTSIYEGSNHCYGICSQDGLEILIHIGIDTVNLKNNAILPKVSLGQKIKENQLIAQVDIEKVRAEQLKLHTMTIITNMEKIKSFHIIEKDQISHGEKVLSYELA